MLLGAGDNKRVSLTVFADVRPSASPSPSADGAATIASPRRPRSIPRRGARRRCARQDGSPSAWERLVSPERWRELRGGVSLRMSGIEGTGCPQYASGPCNPVLAVGRALRREPWKDGEHLAHRIRSGGSRRRHHRSRARDVESLASGACGAGPHPDRGRRRGDVLSRAARLPRALGRGVVLGSSAAALVAGCTFPGVTFETSPDAGHEALPIASDAIPAVRRPA